MSIESKDKQGSHLEHTSGETELPASWHRRRLKELASIRYGKMLATASFTENGYPVFGANGIIGKYSRYLYANKQVLISCRGAYSGTINMSPPMSFVTNNSLVLELRKDGAITRNFLFYALQAADKSKLVTGSAQPQVTINNAEMLEVPVAPLSEQHRIVAEIEKQFTRLEAGVTSLKRVQAALKRYRASVLKAACEGKLVPTEAELARLESRSYEPGTTLLARILEERRVNWNGRGKYKEPVSPSMDQLSPLPEGWTWASVEQLSTKVVDGVHKKPSYVPSGIPFVTVRNLTAGPGISFEKLNYVTRADHAEFLKRANPRRGDILVSKDGTLGVVRVINTDEEFSIFVSVALVKPVLRAMSSYLGAALASPQVQVQMVPKGSGLQHIHLEDLREDCVPARQFSGSRSCCWRICELQKSVGRYTRITFSTVA